jgi:hypothetical protein
MKRQTQRMSASESDFDLRLTSKFWTSLNKHSNLKSHSLISDLSKSSSKPFLDPLLRKSRIVCSKPRGEEGEAMKRLSDWISDRLEDFKSGTISEQWFNYK